MRSSRSTRACAIVACGCWVASLLGLGVPAAEAEPTATPTASVTSARALRLPASSVDSVTTAQQVAIEAARAIVLEKRAAAVEARRRRVAMAYKTYRRGSPSDQPEVWLAEARQHAFAQWLLLSSKREAALLETEAAELQAAQARVTALTGALPAGPMPAFLDPIAALDRVTARLDPGLTQHASGAKLARPGTTYRVNPGANVWAPAAGVVRYVGPVRGLGKVVVISHSADYTSVIGEVGDVFVPVGATVAAGASLARAASDLVYWDVRWAAVPSGPSVAPVVTSP